MTDYALRSYGRKILIAVALVVAAVLLRYGPLRNMGERLPYITFYPAVVFAALYGGRLAGWVATVLSAVAVYSLHFYNNPNFGTLTQWEAMAIFVLTGAAVAQLSERMVRARMGEIHAEQLAKLEGRHAREAEEARKQVAESEHRFRMLFENSPTGMIAVDLKTGHVVHANRVAQEAFGYSEEQLRGKTINELTYPEDLPETSQRNGQLARGEVDHALVEKRYLRKDGSFFWALLSIAAIKAADGKVEFFIGSFTDITEKKRLDVALAESEQTYRTLFENMLNGFAYCRMLYEDDQPRDFIYLDVNTAFETLTGLRDVVGKRVSELIPGIAQSDPKLLEIYGRVARTGQPERFEIYVVALKMWFSIAVYSPRFEHFIAVFDVITERKAAEAKIAGYVRQLEHAMQGTLLAVSKMVEQRDPYTAGHEQCVGIIAADIAREMGWPEDKCTTLSLIGLVHDIGKIAIPVEILTKPTRLAPVEFEIIKGHAETGYRILKDVEFPLPIAEIVHQHHERMDGSGYPHGLRGEEILPEARILAVADVLESMAAHRPYRPALGQEAALKEIVEHRGSLFDPEVVDAVLRLIREKGYRLPSAPRA